MRFLLLLIFISCGQNLVIDRGLDAIGTQTRRISTKVIKDKVEYCIDAYYTDACVDEYCYEDYEACLEEQ